MSNEKILVYSHELKFYRNYCASKNTCIPLIIFSSLYILFFSSNWLTYENYALINCVSWITQIWLYATHILAICYTVFYAKTINSMKYFKIQKELTTIFKLSTAILVVVWITLCFALVCFVCAGDLMPWWMYAQTISDIAIYSLMLCIVIFLLSLSSIGLSKYLKYGKKYEIFSQYKRIKKGE